MAERIAIVVVGMHRSGSSAMARLLSLAGATLPNGLMSAGDGNETGHWEPQSVADYNDTVLAGFDATWDSPFGLGVNATRRAALAPFVEGARTIIREEYGAASLIVLKEPRISLVADLWIQALEAEGFSCKFVITVRPPTEVAASLRKRNGFALDKGLLLWGAYLASAELLTRAHDRVFCRYDNVIVRPASVLDDIETKLRIELPRRTAQAHAAMDAFVRPALKHNDASTIPPIPDHLRPISELSDYIYASIVGEIPNVDISRDLQNWFSDLDQTITPLTIGIEQQLRREQDSAIAAGHAQVEAYRMEIERVNALYNEQLADIARLTAQFAESDELRCDAEQRSAAVEQMRLTTQASLDHREAEMAVLHEALEATNRVVADLSGTLETRAAELAELNADHHTKMVHIAALSDANTNLERAHAAANEALAAQAAESARVATEVDAARADWLDRETALIHHANGLAEANEQAGREYAATLALVETRYEEERAALLVAAQAREAELEATNCVVADLSGTLERRTAELAELNADYQAKMAHMAALSDSNANLERSYADANAALAAQAAESARVAAEVDAARGDWHDRETALIHHANGLADANEQAAREYAATLALVEARYEEERAALLVASQAREAELEATLAVEVDVSQDAARQADQAMAGLHEALAQTHEAAAARTTDLLQQIEVLRAGNAESDAATAQTIAALTHLNDEMVRTHAEEVAAVTVRADEREASLEQLATAQSLLQVKMTQLHETESELRHSVAALTEALEQRDATLAGHVGQIESLIETIADLNRARIAQEEASAADALEFRDREEELQAALTAQIKGRGDDHAERQSMKHRLKAVFGAWKTPEDMDSTSGIR